MNRRDAIKRAALVSGFAVSGSIVSAVLQGCQEVDTTPDWTPEFFSQEEIEQVAAMAETILPRTDTPGAKDVFVDRYIDMIVNNIMSDVQQKRWKDGVTELAGGFQASANKAFADASAEEQLAYLQKADTASRQQMKDGAEKRPFFIDFRQMVVAGYFSSEKVGTEVLAYLPVPGEWIPCGDLQELTGGRNWSL